jgi:hypothetical protein
MDGGGHSTMTSLEAPVEIVPYNRFWPTQFIDH